MNTYTPIHTPVRNVHTHTNTCVVNDRGLYIGIKHSQLHDRPVWQVRHYWILERAPMLLRTNLQKMVSHHIVLQDNGRCSRRRNVQPKTVRE